MEIRTFSAKAKVRGKKRFENRSQKEAVFVGPEPQTGLPDCDLFIVIPPLEKIIDPEIREKIS